MRNAAERKLFAPSPGKGGCHGINSAVHPKPLRFDDEATRLMGEAFDPACKDLPHTGHRVREIIARRIIKAALKGERDPVRLRKAGLAGLGRTRYERP